jgi:hypothetical protein
VHLPGWIDAGASAELTEAGIGCENAGIANPVAPEAGSAPPAGRTFAFYLVPWLLCVLLAAVVMVLTNLAGDGNVLILEGTSMSGTEGARDFAMDDSQLLPFLKRIARADGVIPHFEVLLVTQNMSASAVRSNLLAWRTSN